MSVCIVEPTVDTIVELKEDRDYVMIDVSWEYDNARYIIPVNGIVSDWKQFVRHYVPRDEALYIEKVTYL